MKYMTRIFSLYSWKIYFKTLSYYQETNSGLYLENIPYIPLTLPRQYLGIVKARHDWRICIYLDLKKAFDRVSYQKFLWNSKSEGFKDEDFRNKNNKRRVLEIRIRFGKN